MSEEQTLADVRELEDIIDRLKSVRRDVDEFRVGDHEDAGVALWTGQERSRFMDACSTARTDHARIGEQVEQAIGDCKSRQRTLAVSINPLEHPALSAQALLIALS